MGGFFAGILTWFLGLLFKRTPAPPVRDVENQDLGAAKASGASAEQAAKTETAVAQAEASAPKTQAAVVAALEKGTF